MGKGKNFLKGFLIGATMTVPGASGGTMAMLLGIYEAILGAAADFFRNTKKSLALLAPILAGGCLGALFMTKRVEALLLFFPLEAGNFFAGLVTGGVPLLLWKAGKEKKPVWTALWVLPGALAGMLLPLCPSLIRADGGIGYRLFFLPCAGMALAAALVLPGISASAFLYILGLYEKTLAAVRNHDIGFLMPLLLGCVLGIFLTARLFQRILRKAPAAAQYVIAGFLIASAAEAVGTLPEGGEWRISALYFALGLILMLIFSFYEAGWRPCIKRKERKNGSNPFYAFIRRKGARSRPLQSMAGDLSGEDQR